jgi:hypothetical protein
MRVEELSWKERDGWASARQIDPDLVMYFGARQYLSDGARFEELRKLYPDAHIVGCSTGGQIRKDDVVDDEIAALAMGFDATDVRVATEIISGPEQSRACGDTIGRKLRGHDLAGALVLSDGLNVNGSELVAGIKGAIGLSVPLTGGLAGDGSDFLQTLVGGNCAPRSNIVTGIGFYGTAVRLGSGSAGGWTSIGARRRITRSAGNVLYSLDGEPALDLYERYLGEEADGLPGTALLFPLQINDPGRPETTLVRTVLAVDHRNRSMTFAGDMPQGWSAQLMSGNLAGLAEGAADAARQARNGVDNKTVDKEGAALLISCIGRRLLMGQRTPEEIEAAGAELGDRIKRIGFYSYGEIAPHALSGYCELHNQTMTITTISEATV